MPSPTGQWCDWFEALSPSIASELALAIIQMSPGGLLRSSLVTSSPTDGFTQRIRRLAQNPMQDAGVALMLAALTDFLFMDRSTADRWQRNLTMLEVLDDVHQTVLSEDDALSDQVTDWIAETKLRHPLRARQWVKEYESWRNLRDGALDPAAINRAVLEMMTSTE